MKDMAAGRRCIGWVAATLTLLATAVAGFSDEALIDVVRLKDGTVLRGLIVEQTVGESLKLATLERLVYTLADYEVARVEKQKVRDPVPFHFSDVVLLNDGVMFRGTIVEQRPEQTITLQTENLILLTFATEDIWKILKEKRIAEMPEDSSDKRDREKREGFKIALQLELAKDRVGGQEAAGGEQAGGPQEEIDSLKEEVQALEQEEQRIETALLEDRRLEERERLQGLQQEVERILAEVAGLLEQCLEETGTGAQSKQAAGFLESGVPWPLLIPVRFDLPEPGAWQRRARPGLATDGFRPQPVAQAASAEDLLAGLGTSLDGIVQRTIERIPTEEEVKAQTARQQAYSALVDRLGRVTWKRLGSYHPMRSLAESVPVEDRVFLYETHRRERALLSAGLNLVPILSIGSLVQGDLWGVVLGFGQLALGVYLVGPALGLGDVTQITAAAAGLGGVYVLGVLEPFRFERSWNRRLRNRLLLDDATIRKVQRERARAAVLGPSGLRILPAKEGGVAVQLDLVSLSY
jgi:hypothetical protein